MTLLDRNKRGPKPSAPSSGAPFARKRVSDKPVELAALLSGRPANANKGRSRWGRFVYALCVLLAAAALAAAIGGSGSAELCGLALAVVAVSALLVALHRPPRVRAIYARFPGTSTTLHVGVAIGALAGLGGAQPSLERLRTRAAPAVAADEPSADDLRAHAAEDVKQLRKLVGDARAAAQSGDWEKATAALARAVVIQKPYQGDAGVVLDPELVKELQAVATQAADAERRKRAQAAAEPAPESEKAQPKPTRDASADVEQLKRASAQAEELARAQRWLDADKVYDALLAAIDDLAANPQLKYPPGFSLQEFAAQAKQRATGVRSRALYARSCGDKPPCAADSCSTIASFLQGRAQVLGCSDPVLSAKQCWLTKCALQEGPRGGKRKQTFSISSLGVQPL